jgi:hypothetical protein
LHSRAVSECFCVNSASTFASYALPSGLRRFASTCVRASSMLVGVSSAGLKGESRLSHFESPPSESMQSNWSSALAHPINPSEVFTRTHQSLRPSLMTFAAQSRRACVVLLCNESGIVFSPPLAFGPDVCESLSPIHIPQNDVARLKSQFRQGLQHLHSVRLVRDVHTGQSGHHLPILHSYRLFISKRLDVSSRLLMPLNKMLDRYPLQNVNRVQANALARRLSV